MLGFRFAEIRLTIFTNIMLYSLTETIKKILSNHIKDRYDYPISQVIVEQPPTAELGDLAFPLAFELAKFLKKSPKIIAAEISQEIGEVPGVTKVTVAGGGYLNFFFKRDVFLQELFNSHNSPLSDRKSHKIILEHTNINPNKAAHIGHLRNAILGDTFAHLLRFVGKNVEVQNYIDDTGVQVADVVVGFQYLEKMNLKDIKSITAKFDYYCWDLYAKVSKFYEKDSANRALRFNALKEIEDGQGETSKMADFISTTIVHCHIKTMERIGIQYDLLPKESDIIRLNFWQHAFQLLKDSGALNFEASGKNKGCWIMKLRSPNNNQQSNSKVLSDYDEDKIIVRSNGTVTYVGKDIAYQLWKFGLLGMDFSYHNFYTYPDGKNLAMTNSIPSTNSAAPYGHGSQVYNVIDSRQSYLQNIVKVGLQALSFNEQADKSTHFSYEVVGLSPKCCKDLGISLSDEDQKKTYIEVSGRRGLGVKADDLIDILSEKSKEEVTQRNPGFSEEEKQKIADSIAVGALRYFLLKYTRNSVIAFDFNDALNFEGETGPYLQYTVVRTKSIFRKVENEDPSFNINTISDFINSEEGGKFFNQEINDDYWRLIYLSAQLESTVRISVKTCEPATVAKYLFTLAQELNHFYHRYRIKDEPNQLKKSFLLVLMTIICNQLELGLHLMGISIPPRM